MNFKSLKAFLSDNQGADEVISKQIMFVLMIILVVAFVSGVLYLANMANKSQSRASAQLLDQLNEISQMNITKFEDGEVVGSALSTEIKALANAGAVVLVATTKDIEKKQFVNYGALVSDANDKSSDTDKSKAVTVTHSSGKFLSQGATNSDTASDKIKVIEGRREYTAEFAVDDSTGDIKYERILAPMSFKGSAHFVNPTARFKTFLIRDGGDTLIGVVFEQIKR